MNGPGNIIFFRGGSTMICGGHAEGGSVEGSAEGGFEGGATIGGSAEGGAEVSAGEKKEGVVGTLLKAGVVTRGLGGGGGWVGAREGLGEGEGEGVGEGVWRLVRAQFFVLAIFLINSEISENKK